MNMDFVIQISGYVISGVVALVVASMQHNKTTALLQYRLQQLEEKMDKHNNFMERLATVETKIKLMSKEQ